MFDDEVTSDSLLLTLYVDRLVAAVVAAHLAHRSVAKLEKVVWHPSVGVHHKAVTEMLTGVVELHLSLAVGFEGS